MKQPKPLFMKTYGKQKRRVSAWIAVDNLRKAFDTETDSSHTAAESDTSVFEPPTTFRGKKQSVAARLRRPVRRKAVLTERSFNEENTLSPPRPQSKKTRGKAKGATGRGLHPVGENAVPVLHNSSDKEIIFKESAPCPQPTQQSRRTRTSRVVSQPAALKRRRDQDIPRSSENEEDSMSAAKYLKRSLEEKSSNHVSFSSVGRFVTRRRRAVTTAKIQKATVNIADSSDDFTTSATSRIHLPLRNKKTGKRRIPRFLESSADSSAAAVLGADPCQELSLGELTDLSVGRRLRKPICCSTPSAPALGQRLLEESTSPAAASAGVPGMFPEWLDSPGRPVSTTPGHQSEEKENSLTKACTVRLQRLSPPADPCSPTVYLSSLSRLSNQQDQGHQPQPADNGSQCLEPSLNLHLSTTQSFGHFQSANGSQSPSEHTPEVAASQSANLAESTEHPALKEPLSVELIDSTCHSDICVDFILDTHLQEDTGTPARLSEAVKSTCLSKQCYLKVENLSVEKLQSLMQRKASPESELETMLKKSCLSSRLAVRLKRLPVEEVTHFLLPRAAEAQSAQPETDSSQEQAGSSSLGDRSTSSSSSDRDGEKKPRDKTREKKDKRGRRSVSADRPGTTRKVCVSGLSVSRWKSKDTSQAFRGRAAMLANSSVDCSINELVSTQHRAPREVGSTMNFCTPVKLNRSSILSLLADFTPSKHTWSRIKAALSIHRKVLLTPSSDGKTPHRAPRLGNAALSAVSQDLFATPRRLQGGTPQRSTLLSSGSVGDGADLSDGEKVYAECGQQGPLAWEECIPPQRMKRCVKIGEGTFGEVFSTTSASGEPVALKIIPVEGSEKVNGEDQKTFGDILHEIIISKELSSLKEKQRNKTFGFIGLIDLHCIRGCYPPEFLSAWDTFDEQRGSENDRPDFFEKDQVFIMLEFEFGGTDLENSNGTFNSLSVAKSVLHQVTAALAVAEQELQFEHRDLHWGNVLVKTTRQKKEKFLLNGASHSVDTRGVLVRIIDYSLSRLAIDGLTVSCDISQDEELFMGQGDYQFDIYRLMKQENGNDWSTYRPHSNVLWLHYLCSKLLSMKYRHNGGKAGKAVREELTRFHGNVLQYASATEALQSCPMFQ